MHEQSTQIVPLQIGAVIYASDPAGYDQLSLSDGQGLYRAQPDSALHGSAAAAQAMFDLFADSPGHAVAAAPSPAGTPRIGVFICQCGDQIARTVDTETVRQRAALWPDVVQAQVLPFSCSPEAAETIHKAIIDYGLNRVVLAACSCCSIDQVCYSCTYQRIRCKDNLGVFLHAAVHTAQPVAAFEFVNIREQCAWVHASEPQAATTKATALVAAAAARVRAAPPPSQPLAAVPQPVDRSVLILGSGAAAIACQRALSAQGIAARRVPGTPSQVARTGGRFRIVQQQSDHGWQGSAVVLAPRNASEAQQLLAAFGEDGQRPRPQTLWGGLDTHRPGILICDPALPAETAGVAAAARITAWLGRSELAPSGIAASVDPGRCRACNTCVELCEFGAPQLVGQDPERSSWIDPAICTGCGTCAAHCPSGAITAGYATDAQLDAALQAALI
jgi:heterodisulfide reductase subunit A-like polyferredoxin